jgi:hypothetical protein
VADTYGVTPADVAAELPGIFPGGFTATTLPSDALVADFIAAADLAVTLKLKDTTGGAPAATDAAAKLAKRYVIESAKAQVLRVAYAGAIPPTSTSRWRRTSCSRRRSSMRSHCSDSQAIGTGDAAPRVTTSLGASGLPTRDLLITDCDLDPSSAGGSDVQNQSRSKAKS